VPHNAHLIFDGVQSDSLLFLLDQRGISVSAGSACQAGVLAPSHVLLAMGYSEAQAAACLRITLGRTTTQSDVDVFIDAIVPSFEQSLLAGLSSRAI
jgi:cysteine desulfurase